MSTPVAGALAVTPLYTTSGDALVSWDDPGQTWRSLAYLPLSGGTISGNLTIIGLLSAISLELGPDDGVTTPYIDFHGATTWTDWATRLIRFAGDNGQFVIASRGTGGLNFNSADAAPLILGTSSTERLRITPSGSVGIGTASPVSKLDVAGGAAAPALNVSTGSIATITASTNAQLQFGAYNGTPSYATWVQSKTDASNASLPLALQPLGGNVGIGTASPSGALHVARTIAYNATYSALIVSDGASLGKQLGMGYDAAVGANGAGFIQASYPGVAYTNLLLNPGGGNVGIQTISPGSLFTVNGTAGNPTGVWSVVSAREMKQEIAPYERGLEAIVALNPCVFRYRAGTPYAKSADEPSDLLIGLMADEVEPHVPEIVGEMTATVGDKSDVAISTLAPGLLVFSLINSVKTLAEQNAALSLRIEALEGAAA